MKPHYPDDQALVAACLAGEETAWAVLQNRCNPVIYAILRRPQWRFNEQDIEDLCEEIYLKLMESGLRQFQFRSSLTTYIATITKRFCLDRVRGRTFLRSPLSLDTDTAGGLPFDRVLDSGICVAELVMRRETAREINNAYNQLKDECRQILSLRYREEMAYDQIAIALKKPIGTVCALISRCLDRLSELVQLDLEPSKQARRGKS